MQIGPRLPGQSTILCGVLALLVTSLGFGGCASDSQDRDGRGRSRGPVAVEGMARDSDTGEPIERAWIFEAVPVGTVGADLERIASIQTERSDDEGRFRFEPRPEAKGLSMKRTYPPRYHFYHPSYGLVRGREAKGEPVEFTVSLRNAHLRQRDAAAYCSPAKRQAEAANGMALKLVELGCPPADPSSFSNGQARATGPTDDRGRRNGAWTFYRKDKSIIAKGTYAAGAAVDPWAFYPPGQKPPESAPE